jgi:hypothetical protein
MSGTLTTHEVYPLSDFPNGRVNPEILTAEVVAAALSVPLQNLIANGSNVTFVFTGSLLAGDITLLNGVVANHQGAAFTNTSVAVREISETTNTTNTWTDKLVLNAGPLPAGTYMAFWACEYNLAAVVANSVANARYQFNGTTYVVDTWTFDGVHTFSGGFPVDLTAGSMVVASLQSRLTGPANTLLIRRARMSLTRIG